MRLEGVAGLSRPINDEERLYILKKHANTGVEINGSVYMPDSGITASGYAIGVIRNADFVIEIIDKFIDELSCNNKYIYDILLTKEQDEIKNLKFDFFIDDNGFGLIETSTKVFFKLYEGGF